MKETAIARQYAEFLQQDYPDAHCVRVENAAESGTPDLNCCANGVEWWVEVKRCRRFEREKTMLDVRFEAEQVPWIERHVAAGGRVFVLLFVSGSKRDPQPAYYMVPGYLAGALAARRLRENDLRLYYVGTRPFGRVPTLYVHRDD